MKTKLGNNESLKEQLKIINWYPALKRYCRTITRSNWDGDDLAQETMVKMFRSYIDKDISSHNISPALMYRIAQNQWIDYIRKGSKEAKELLNEPSYEPMKNLPDLYSIVEKLVLKLTPQQTVVFILKDVFQFSLSDIAEYLSMSEGSIKASLFRTRNRLKTIRIESDEGNDTEQSIINNEDQEIFFKSICNSIRKEDPSILIEFYQLIYLKQVESIRSITFRSAENNLQLRAA
ncbi:sigma-70 family RNA polymerase sigma factor [Heyndrickxia sp. NPDC080065]|uniref:sigma-70 family RNA polymerase sigma factor n=1 Tax=Heyndrickxia sp. NPDC080065 TaxID=3390568 RepID=UPI003D04E6F3